MKSVNLLMKFYNSMFESLKQHVSLFYNIKILAE